MSGGYEPEEVDAEIEAIDQFFVPTHEGKTFYKNGHCKVFNTDLGKIVLLQLLDESKRMAPLQY